MKGYFTKKNTEPKKILKEFRIEKTEEYVGIHLCHFIRGMKTMD